MEMFNATNGLAIVNKALTSQSSAALATGEAAAFAVLHAFKHGNPVLINKLFDGSKPSFRNSIIGFIRALNAVEVVTQENLAVSATKADIFGRSDGAFFVKKGRRAACEFFLDGIGEGEKAEQFAVDYLVVNHWEKEKAKAEKTEKAVKPAVEFLASRLTKLYDEIARTYSDDLSASVMQEIESALKQVRRVGNLPEPERKEVKPFGMAAYIAAKSDNEASVPDGSVKATGKKVKAA